MPTSDVDEQEPKADKRDTRILCKYGTKCYQKNPTHHSKYKHPPKERNKDEENSEQVSTGRKRTSSERDDDEAENLVELPESKQRRKDTEDAVFASDRRSSLSVSPGPSPDNGATIEERRNESSERLVDKNAASTRADAPKACVQNGKVATDSIEIDRAISNEVAEEEGKTETETETRKKDESDIALAPSTDPEQIIRDLFLTEMPEDFYKLYDFCTVLSPKDPCGALKLVDLWLVGPYDALNGRIASNAQKDAEKYLRHWRYYYDPPEFQTILKGNEKEGLHYGYWRDAMEDEPVFVAKNSANNDYKIVPVGPNVFSAVSCHMEEKARRATPFEKGAISRLSKQLKAFAKANDVKLEKENARMRSREKKVVAKTFHGAGIVVPYDKKTQLGYRDLAATDSQLKRILKQLEEATESGEQEQEHENKKKAMSSIEEVVRLATIAADECDFGTCLELGHDLFSSGVLRVQRTGLQMLAAAYKLLNREKLLKVAEAHAKDRKRDCRDLSVI